VQQGDKLVEGAAVVGRGNAVDGAVQLEGIGSGDVPDQLVALAHDEGDLPQEISLPFPGHVAEDARLAPDGMQKPGEHLERRRFPRAVGAQEADDLSRGEVEGDAVHSGTSFFCRRTRLRRAAPTPGSRWLMI